MAGRGYIGVFVSGCVVLYGPDSPVKAAAVLECMPAGVVVNRDLAARIGASLVVGLREDLERLPVDELSEICLRMVNREPIESADKLIREGASS